MPEMAALGALSEPERAVVRKAAARLIPFLCLLYFVAFLDRVNVGFAALTQLPAVGYSPLLFVVILIGFGGAGTAFGSIVMASRELSDGDQGLAGGVINTSRQVGAAVGAALLPAVAGSISGVSGDRAAMLTATVAALAATGVSWRAARQAPPATAPSS